MQVDVRDTITEAIRIEDERLISASRAARSPWCRNSQSAPKGSRFTGCGATAS